MPIERVAVVGASGRQGLAQIRQLRRQGYDVVGVTRRKPVAPGPDFDAVTWIAADLNQPASLDAVFAGVDAVFYTPPAFAEAMNRLTHVRNVGEAAVRAGVERVVHNTCVHIPDDYGVEAPYDYVLDGVIELEKTGAPVATFGPVLFYDNLLADWSLPSLLNGTFSYPHKPGFRASWMAADDAALFMIEALKRDDLLGIRLNLGGPEVLTPDSLCRAMTSVLGFEVVHEPITPRVFAEVMWGIFGDVTGIDQQAFVDQLDGFYQYSNAGPAEPFAVDMAPVLQLIPVQLQTLEEWGAQQSWTMTDDRPPGG